MDDRKHQLTFDECTDIVVYNLCYGILVGSDYALGCIHDYGLIILQNLPDCILVPFFASQITWYGILLVTIHYLHHCPQASQRVLFSVGNRSIGNPKELCNLGIR